MGVNKCIEKGGVMTECVLCGKYLPDCSESEDRYILLVNDERFPLCHCCFERKKSLKRIFSDLHDQAEEFWDRADYIESVADDVLKEIKTSGKATCKSIGYVTD